MTLATTLILMGRIALGLFFLIGGIRNVLRFAERKSPATNYGWKLPMPVATLGYVTQILAGAAVLFGIQTVWGAASLIIFLICATALFHNPLMFKGAERQPHIYFTLVNCALVGYCLLVIGHALSG